MNKFWLILLGIFVGIVALSNLGALICLAISGLIVYAGIHFYLKSYSTIAKVWWGFVGVIGALSAISNVPALIGLAALFVLWMIYRKWNDQPLSRTGSDDPFTNFERQWEKLKNKEE